MASRVVLALLDYREELDSLDLVVNRDLLEKLESLGIQASKVHKDYKVR